MANEATNGSKKKKAVTTGLAVALAAALVLGGGTYAYLQDSDGPVTNTFSTNSNDVELEETTGEDYDIVPGTSQDKDPIVTAAYTLDSYVFVEVTDATDDLVTWYIANGWTLLETTVDSTSGDTTYVYYQLLKYDADKAEGGVCTSDLHVLKGDKVYYSADITNADLATVTDIELTFQSYIIQAEPFADAENAWKVLQGQTADEDGNISYTAGMTVDLDTGVVYDTVSDAITAADDGDTIYLMADGEVTVNDLSVSKELTIDLNENALTTETSSYSVGIYDDMTISNGELNLQNGTGSKASIALTEGSSLTLDSLTVNIDDNDDNNAGSIVVSSGVDDATLTIKNTTINSADYYAVSTNASNAASGANVVINIENSTLTTTEKHNSDHDSAAVLFNIPGTLNITGSTITGERQGVIVRCGTANISDSTITTTAEYTDSTLYYGTTSWKSGNEVPVAALVAGNYGSNASYPHNASVVLDDVTLVVGSNTDTVPAIYAAQNNGSYALSTTVTGAKKTDSLITVAGNGTVTVNGTTASNGYTTKTTVGAFASAGATE